MKILFITENNYPYDGACTSILKKLLFDGGLLCKTGEVHVLTFKYDYQDPELEEVDGVTVHRTFLWSRMTVSQLKKSFLKHPAAVGGACLTKLWQKLRGRVFLKPEMYQCLYRALRRIGGETFDTIVCIAGDFETVQAAWMLKKKAPRVNMVIYQVDPCSTNLTAALHTIKQRRAFEDKVYAAAKAIVTTDIICREQETRQPTAVMARFIPMEFPLVIDAAKNVHNSDTDKGNIQCLFAGNIYGGIRNPAYTLQLFGKVKETDTVSLHMVGVTEADIGMETVPENVHCYGQLPLKQAHQFIQKADVLVNIGNIMTNQVPSKIFDYISTGKPIINVCKSRDCPTLKYLQKYPLCLNLFEEEQLLEKQAARMEKFILENYDKRLTADNLTLIYPECMVDFCAKQMYNAIQ